MYSIETPFNETNSNQFQYGSNKGDKGCTDQTKGNWKETANCQPLINNATGYSLHGKLDYFAIASIDQCHQIFGMLSPRDLINLSRVDASFCHTLTAHNVSFIWKAMREVERGIEPPRGVPEYRWVDLLFGKLICDVSRCSV